MATRIELKRGALGDIYSESAIYGRQIVRDLSTAPRGFGWLARLLARREAAALKRLAGLAGTPELLLLERGQLIRTELPGDPMHHARPQSPEYFRQALRLLRQMHRLGVTHNDLAKEANWLCNGGLEPGIIDYQLAICFRRRTRLFRMLAREDLRHLLKHKRHYCPEFLTARQRQLLATPLWPARLWRLLFKPGYVLLTRGILGWPEREGAAERERTTDKTDGTR